MELIQFTEDLILRPDAIIGIRIVERDDQWVFNIMLDEGILVEVRSFDTREELVDFKNMVLLQLLTPKEEVNLNDLSQWSGIGQPSPPPAQNPPNYLYSPPVSSAMRGAAFNKVAADELLDTTSIMESMESIMQDMGRL
jgi:hypothetical protein